MAFGIPRVGLVGTAVDIIAGKDPRKRDSGPSLGLFGAYKQCDYERVGQGCVGTAVVRHQSATASPVRRLSGVHELPGRMGGYG